MDGTGPVPRGPPSPVHAPTGQRSDADEGTADRIVYASDALASAGDDLFLICDRLRLAAESAMNAMNPPTTTSDEGVCYV